jgi:hypothetical protein
MHTDRLRQAGPAIAALTPAPQHPALTQLVESLRRRHGDCVAAVLFYGSCLRGGDPFDGVVDLYLLVDNYRCANAGLLKAAWNRVLPPNVFYAEFAHSERTLRCKYAIVSLPDLDRGTSRRWFHSYLWGRFSQPTAIAWWRDAPTRARVEADMARSVTTFLQRVIPRVAPQGSVASLWRDGLALSYRAELRAESPQRASQIVTAGLHYYEQVTRVVAADVGYDLKVYGESGIPRYRARTTPLQRALARSGWWLRIAQGKVLSVLRLLKALFTFDGGLDYIAWKLERHSGVPIDIPPRVRRYPLIFIWGLFWDLYRRGIFR